MKATNSTSKKWLVFINVLIFAVGSSVCFLLCILDGTKVYIASALCLWIGIQGSAIAITVSLCVRKDKQWHFDKSGVVEQNALHKNRLIPYSNIRAIMVCVAVDSYFYPLYDEHGVPRSVIVIYDNLDIANSHVKPNAIYVLPDTPLSDALSCSFFTPDKLKTLMAETKAEILVPVNTYEANKNQLDVLFATHKDRVMLAVSNDDTQSQLVEYELYRPLHF